jgi:hypothetical protein
MQLLKQKLPQKVIYSIKFEKLYINMLHWRDMRNVQVFLFVIWLYFKIWLDIRILMYFNRGISIFSTIINFNLPACIKTKMSVLGIWRSSLRKTPGTGRNLWCTIESGVYSSEGEIVDMWEVWKNYASKTVPEVRKENIPYCELIFISSRKVSCKKLNEWW